MARTDCKTAKVEHVAIKTGEFQRDGIGVLALRNYATGTKRRKQMTQCGVNLMLGSEDRIRASTARQMSENKPPDNLLVEMRQTRLL